MKLLLKGHKLDWFVRGVYEVRWRYKNESRGTVLWEQIGAARYAFLCFKQTLGKWL